MKRAVVFRSPMRARPDLRGPIPLLTEAIDVDFGVHREPPLLTDVVSEGEAEHASTAAFGAVVRQLRQRRRA
jgi:hypothetical protein